MSFLRVDKGSFNEISVFNYCSVASNHLEAESSCLEESATKNRLVYIMTVIQLPNTKGGAPAAQKTAGNQWHPLSVSGNASCKPKGWKII